MKGPPAVRPKFVPPWYCHTKRWKSNRIGVYNKVILVSQKTNHVIVNKRSSFLNEPSNCKCQILNGSLVNWTPKLIKPSGLPKEVRENRTYQTSKKLNDYNETRIRLLQTSHSKPLSTLQVCRVYLEKMHHNKSHCMY